MNSIQNSINRAINGKKFNFLITETFDLALKQAEIAKQNGLKPFTVVVKDNIAVENVKMTCASQMLDEFDSPYTSTVIQRLINNGGCVIGKSNMDAFAMGSTSSQSYYGPTKSSLTEFSDISHDWRIAGGSSGGCAVAVHLGAADIAIGTDTGGSTRNPAAFHGIFGFKPSYGTLSRHGVVPLANTFDAPAIFANTIDDCYTYYKMMAGVDTNDSTSINPLPKKEIKLKDMTIGIPKEYCHPMLAADTIRVWEDAINKLIDKGCNVINVELPHTEYSIICYHILAETDIASNMARFDGISFGYRDNKIESSFNELLAQSRTQSLNDTIKRRIIVGNFYNVRENRGKYFQQAARLRRLIKNDFDQVYTKVDALITPVTTHSVPLYSEVEVKFKSKQREDDYFTQPANMAGLPAISVPFGYCSKGFPIGLQIICNYLEDYLCLDLAKEMYNLKSDTHKLFVTKNT